MLSKDWLQHLQLTSMTHVYFVEELVAAPVFTAVTNTRVPHPEPHRASTPCSLGFHWQRGCLWVCSEVCHMAAVPVLTALAAPVSWLGRETIVWAGGRAPGWAVRPGTLTHTQGATVGVAPTRTLGCRHGGVRAGGAGREPERTGAPRAALSGGLAHLRARWVHASVTDYYNSPLSHCCRQTRQKSPD